MLAWAFETDEDTDEEYASYTLSAKYIGDEGYVVRAVLPGTNVTMSAALWLGPLEHHAPSFGYYFRVEEENKVKPRAYIYITRGTRHKNVKHQGKNT